VTDLHTVCREQIEAHFTGRISSRAEHQMRAHLTDCAPCRRRYELRRELETQLDPMALDASVRIGRGLGLVRARRPMFTFAASLSVAAAAACLLFVFPPPAGPMSAPARSAFTARGTPPARAMSAGGSELAGDLIRPGDELAFSYVNSDAYPYLAVCAIDEHDHVYWYHPAWTSAEEDPASISIRGGLESHEIPVAIAHELDGKTLRIVAAFTRRPVHVRELERELVGASRAGVPFARALSDAFGDVSVSQRSLKVAP
jgi:hypothetical protein